jgi:hypothetical protein
VHGACIINDFFDPISPDPDDNDINPLFTCDETQANYILRPRTRRTEIFNSVVLASKASIYKTFIPRETSKSPFRPDGPRMQLELDKDVANKAFMAKYKYQMDILLQHIFRNDEFDKKSPKNWICKMNNICGGTEHQHPHADLGRPMQFRDEETYPFTATHGFGCNTFQLWMLPNSNDVRYGYLHTFSASCLVLLRGDFLHAGGVAKEPRCNMQFYPLPPAGLVHGHEDHYWLEQDYTATEEEARSFQTSFLWQGPHFPFAYPFATYRENSMGRVRTVLSYPPAVTKAIIDTKKDSVADSRVKEVASQRF